jgi:hypothetical protein
MSNIRVYRSGSAAGPVIPGRTSRDGRRVAGTAPQRLAGKRRRYRHRVPS